ncbi:MAG TPA: acyl-CoA dehydratase activase [Methylomusa anaerophila]|uniref:R-phenyllactate dehydratase activator n=1 Tax=Methylomusa anaerophila TaxID=1930071 RepID=A0A348AEM5_9FIRM|nr:2-hydroxyacyl-CoA dehydratase [Methylomusa anaerophila]BBB89523.1 R-phenyllactate dehydratase activator [Methylomusa anaerophila]HML90107.1 acyl-CoA dehydratase activase [Methylomusa anaerophila]
MKIAEVIDESLVSTITGSTVVGIDIGSRTAKAVLLSGDEIHTAQVPTGIDMQETAEELLAELLEASGKKRTDISYIVGTGYGRVALSFADVPNQIVTEISCHALGSHYLNAGIKTIIDIGGQDSKGIKVDPETGKVVEFVMNDKCAAGTGRFLERVAQLLDLDLSQLGETALRGDKPAEISSQCVVFAESEVVSLRARGESPENIAAGIHLATARRVKNLLSRIGLEPGLAFSGGVANNIGMRKAIENLMEHPISEFKLDAIYAGAVGAAVHALNFEAAGVHKGAVAGEGHSLDLTELHNRIAKQQEIIITQADGRKNVGYLCTYTPLELINAAGVNQLRLFKMGDTQIVASGEQITQSVFCDFTKSILGAFKEGDPLYTALDKVYTFYTCDCIKKVGEAVGDFFTPSDIYILPRLRHKESSRDYYRTEILNFKEDLEKLSGNTVDVESVREQIKLYNKVRAVLRKISELRKRDNPPLKGGDLLELIKGYYYLPPAELLVLYEQIYEKLTAVPDEGNKPIRLMMAGGIVADGDRRLLELIENTVGARVVIEDHCTGSRNVGFHINEEGDPYQALAEGYLDQSPCTRMKPLYERVEISGQLAQEYKVDGVLYVYLKFCPCYGQIKHEFFRHYQKLGIPVLEVPVDYSASDQGQLKTRLEAFVEVLGERGENTDGDRGHSKSA